MRERRFAPCRTNPCQGGTKAKGYGVNAMNRLFHRTDRPVANYVALAIFAAVFLGVFGLVLTPASMLQTPASLVATE